MNHKLPFKIQPKPFEIVKVGDETVGIIELPKKLGLTPAEEIFIKDSMKGQTDIQAEAIEISQKVASATGKSIFEIYTALNKGNTEVLGDHLGELIKLQSQSEEASLHRKIATVSALIKYRLEKDWSVADTQELAPALIDAVYDFAVKEQNAWVEPEPEPLTEEQLGKL